MGTTRFAFTFVPVRTDIERQLDGRIAKALSSSHGFGFGISAWQVRQALSIGVSMPSLTTTQRQTYVQHAFSMLNSDLEEGQQTRENCPGRYLHVKRCRPYNGAGLRAQGANEGSKANVFRAKQGSRDHCSSWATYFGAFGSLPLLLLTPFPLHSMSIKFHSIVLHPVALSAN